MDREEKKLEKILITTKEAMELLGIKSRTLLNWYVEKHNLPYIKIGHFLRFPLEELKKWKEKKFEKIAA